jgi:hypothetical protein
MEQFINGYNPDYVLRTKNTSECFSGAKPASENSVCFFDIRTIDQDCIKPDFGYDTGSPCIFIQFNNISGWKPEFYSETDFLTNPGLLSDSKFLNRQNLVYLECKGLFRLFINVSYPQLN